MSHTTRPVRVRIAPSPTGPFHIGRSRAAILNWLFARHHNGTFILRIEDTDRKRSDPAHMQGILDSLRWLGLDWDEGPDIGGPHAPYYQMGRLDSYRAYAGRLLEQGRAYRCYCTTEELDAQREQARAEKRAYRYPGTCRNLTAEQQGEKQAQGIVPVLRIVIPEGSTTFDDMILGPITVQHAELDDFVIMKSDDIPAYNFAVVIDDVTMEISHVIRGQDHVPNTPKQVIIYTMLGEAPPVFAHFPLVVGMEGKKISARHGAKAVVGMGEDGYVPDAVLHYVAGVGGSFLPDEGLFTKEQLIAYFDLSKVSRSAPAFDEAKLDSLNGEYLRALPLQEFVARALPFLQLRGLLPPVPSEQDIAYASRALALEQERVRTLGEAPDAIEFFFTDRLLYDPELLVQRKSSTEEARAVLQGSLEILASMDNFAHDDLEHAFRSLAESMQLKTGVVFGTIRVAITGRTAAPPLFDTMLVLGRDRVRARIEGALLALQAAV